MNCMNRNAVENTLEKIISLLDDAHLSELIDQPMNRILSKLQHVATQPISRQEFHKIVASFVNELYLQGFGLKTMPDPLAESLYFLDKFYQGIYSRGYFAARLDANNADYGGIDIVLRGLAEVIKDIERGKYINGIFRKYLDSCDWQIKCNIAETILEKYKPCLPPLLAQCKPEQIAEDIPSIILACLNAENILNKMSNTSLDMVFP